MCSIFSLSLCLLFNLKSFNPEAVIPECFWRGSNHLFLNCEVAKSYISKMTLLKTDYLITKSPELPSSIKIC